MAKDTVTLSIIIPFFNEEEAIYSFFKRFKKAKKKLPRSLELLLVNDGSKDKTEELLQKHSKGFRRTIISFSRNFGHQAALLAGLEEARGKYIVTMDADLQHPPELISEMIALQKKGYDVVLTKRIETEKSNTLKVATASFFYWLINRISNTRIERNASDFRCINSTVQKALLSLPESRKFLRGMVQWVGFKTVILPFRVEERVAGNSKYSLAKMLQLALHGLTSFSTVPLYLAGAFSFLLFALAFLYAFYVLYVSLVSHTVVPGWSSVILILLLLTGFLSFFLGLFGVYLAAVYEEVKKRPNYICQKKISRKS